MPSIQTLEKVMTYIHNWFEVSIRPGTWEVTGGCLDLPFLIDGQYFRITGSVFSDGLHQYPDTELKDERFSGIIYGLAVPQAVVELAQEIEQWESDNAKALNSPYSSESFGGYGYSKDSSVSGGGNDDPAGGWQRHFMSRFIPWRKL